MAITTNSGDITTLTSGSIQRFKETRLLLNIQIDVDDSVRIEVRAFDSGGVIYYNSTWFSYTSSQLDAYTGAGTGEFAPFKNVCEQAVKASLEAISENSTVTFTIV